MIIWNGRGFLVAVVAFACLLLSEYGTESYFSDQSYYQQYGWPKLLGFTVAALLIGALALVWKPKRGNRDTMFFIPMLYWSPILLGLGVVFYFVRE